MASNAGQALCRHGHLHKRTNELKSIINSLLPLGRYINMDPTPTELVISQTQLIWFGQFLGGWICNNQLHLPSIMAENMQFQQCSQENFVIDIYLFFISILSRNELIVVTTFWLLIPCHTFRTNGWRCK